MTPDGDDRIVITRDDLTAEIRAQGQCSCPSADHGRLDFKCPQHGLPEAAQVRVLGLRPDDVLVILTPGPLPRSVAERIKDVIAARLGHQRVMVLDEGMDVAILRRS